MLQIKCGPKFKKINKLKNVNLLYSVWVHGTNFSLPARTGCKRAKIDLLCQLQHCSKMHSNQKLQIN